MGVRVLVGENHGCPCSCFFLWVSVFLFPCSCFLDERHGCPVFCALVFCDGCPCSCFRVLVLCSCLLACSFVVRVLSSRFNLKEVLSGLFALY